MNRYFSILDRFRASLDDNNVPIRIILDQNDIHEWQHQRVSQLIQGSCPSIWADIGIVFDDPYVVILRDLVEFPGGGRGGYIRLYNRAYLEGGAAGVAMLPEKDGQVLLLYNFRHATRSWHWEIPRGFGEPGVGAEAQAHKEIAEETGGVVSELVDLGLYYNNTGLEGNPVYLFLARLETVGQPETTAGIDTMRWTPLDELEQMIACAEITDGFTIAAYTRAKLNGLI